MMARPKQTETNTMLRILDSYFESVGDPSKLKCSLLEEYAASIGIYIKAYAFRRDTAVRQRMEELRDVFHISSEYGALAYKSLDVDAMLNRCRTKTMLRNCILEMDETWRRIYERAKHLSAENNELKAAAMKSTKDYDQLSNDNTDLSEHLKQIKKANKEIALENRYLKKMLKTYLYPAIANEILIRENVLLQADTAATTTAMGQLVDEDVPSPLSGAVTKDIETLSREASLLNRMRNQIEKG